MFWIERMKIRTKAIYKEQSCSYCINSTHLINRKQEDNKKCQPKTLNIFCFFSEQLLRSKVFSELQSQGKG